MLSNIFVWQFIAKHKKPTQDPTVAFAAHCRNSKSTVHLLTYIGKENKSIETVKLVF